jgi:hypothetical protein
MFRHLLPVATLIAAPATAQQLELPPITGDPPAQAAPACRNIPHSPENCVRVLACIGTAGRYFDGQARGWDQGTVTGTTSDGVTCTGTWRSDGLMGSGTSWMKCSDGVSIEVLYYTQDNRTGTVIGRGRGSAGQPIRVWTGTNVLAYLAPEGRPSAELPCGGAPIPIS